MKTDTLNLAAFAENPDNPQTVTDEAYTLLVQSIRDTPQTLEAAKIAYCTDYVALDGTDMTGRCIVIAGNKRLRALKEIYGAKADVPAAWFFDLTPLGEEARRRWLVKSNIQSGEWDLDKLLALYSEDELGALMGDDNLGDLLASIDMFSGSGAFIVACEKTGRVCYGMELDPHYCDVIRRRWAEFVHGEGCDWQSLTPTVLP